MPSDQHREAATPRDRGDTAVPRAPFLILLLAALASTTHSVWHGHWQIMVVNAVVVVLALWALRLPYRRTTHIDQSPGPGESTDTPGDAHPVSSPQATSSSEATDTAAPATPRKSPVPAVRTVGPPVVSSFAITGRIHDPGTTAALTVVLPADTEVPTASVVAALLTAGHRILNDHGFTNCDLSQQQLLPAVDVTVADRAAEPPTTGPGRGFTVGITNDLTTARSDLTLETHQLAGTHNAALLIAATLLAGAEHLLEGLQQPFTDPQPTGSGPGHQGENLGAQRYGTGTPGTKALLEKNA